MAIYASLQDIRKLSNSSLTSIIDITNLNFKSLSEANLEFLNNNENDLFLYNLDKKVFSLNIFTSLNN